MKKILISIIVVTLLITGCKSEETNNDITTDQEKPGYQKITADKAMEMMETEEGYIIVDVRTQDEYLSGHIAQAICIPNESIGEQEIAQLPEKDQVILVYCRSGNRSKQASEKLVNLGYTNVYEFGGIIDWTGETVMEE